jgi:MSHA biogenesis protein MshN
VEEPRSVSKGPAAQPKAIKPPLPVGQTPSPPTTGIALKPAAAVIEAKPVMMSSPANEVPPVVKPRIVEAVSENSPQTAPSAARIDKQVKQLTPAQAAENEYREAANFLSQGRIAEAQESFRQALQHNPGHIGARQGLFGLMVDARRPGEAEQLLREGLKLNANQPGFAMALARLQLDRNDVTAAIETLQGSAAGAQNSPDYLAFHAALLQRQTRHREAAEQYQAALRLAPQSGVWLMGLGISLQALNRTAEAQDAFRRARASNSLSADLQAFVEQRLRQLQ